MNPAEVNTGQTLTFTRRNGEIVTVKTLSDAYWGPFGWAVTCTVLDSAWQGRTLDIQASDLTATS